MCVCVCVCGRAHGRFCLYSERHSVAVFRVLVADNMNDASRLKYKPAALFYVFESFYWPGSAPSWSLGSVLSRLHFEAFYT